MAFFPRRPKEHHLQASEEILKHLCLATRAAVVFAAVVWARHATLPPGGCVAWGGRLQKEISVATESAAQWNLICKIAWTFYLSITIYGNIEKDKTVNDKRQGRKTGSHRNSQRAQDPRFMRANPITGLQKGKGKQKKNIEKYKKMWKIHGGRGSSSNTMCNFESSRKFGTSSRFFRCHSWKKCQT